MNLNGSWVMGGWGWGVGVGGGWGWGWVGVGGGWGCVGWGGWGGGGGVGGWGWGWGVGGGGWGWGWGVGGGGGWGGGGGGGGCLTDSSVSSNMKPRERWPPDCPPQGHYQIHALIDCLFNKCTKEIVIEWKQTQRSFFSLTHRTRCSKANHYELATQ